MLEGNSFEISKNDKTEIEGYKGKMVLRIEVHGREQEEFPTELKEIKIIFFDDKTDKREVTFSKRPNTFLNLFLPEKTEYLIKNRYVKIISTDIPLIEKETVRLYFHPPFPH